MARKKFKKVTTREQLAIVEEAIRLIQKPASWCKRKWLCEIGKDRRGNPVLAYCVDGAIGQAAINVLGAKRAANTLGVNVDYDIYETPMVGDGGESADYLSIRALAFEIARDRGIIGDEDKDDGDSYHVSLNDNNNTTHADILGLLRWKAKEIRSKVRALDEIAARKAARRTGA